MYLKLGEGDSVNQVLGKARLSATALLLYWKQSSSTVLAGCTATTVAVPGTICAAMRCSVVLQQHPSHPSQLSTHSISMHVKAAMGSSRICTLARAPWCGGVAKKEMQESRL